MGGLTISDGTVSVLSQENSLSTPQDNNAEESANQNLRKENYIYQILNSTYEESFLLAAYDFEQDEEKVAKLLETKKSTYFSKNKVAKLIINNEFWRTNSYNISSDRLEALAEATCELFPDFLKESFYTRPSNTKAAGGAFQTYYSKQREKEIAIGRLKINFLERRKRTYQENQESDDFVKLKQPVHIIDEDFKQLWCNSALKERISFYEKTDVRTIFETFCNLKHSVGYYLVQVDFEKNFNIQSNIFAENWPSIGDKVIKIAKKKKSTDELIKQIFRENALIKDDDHKNTLALILLPLIFKRIAKQTTKSKTKTHWNPHKEEILKSFIVHIKETVNFKDELQAVENNLLEMHNDHKIKLQPYVIINGPSLNDVKSAFVVLDNYKYQVSSPVVAVDICFQCMKVFGEKYSSVCNHVWQFIEREVYKFEVKDLYTAVASVIENMRKVH
ncbi:uncharacterized protein LOC122503626 [Leptopilina heterotoma]|uniref:uncharacterized protein LOC122503626 n=1 Tax=Leptopilina heterotoma TaxID=63436 RepID=UPI001CA9D7FB|nr:uncharacterized protein LOC122503626 [Leptopilina heterotoma]